MASLDWIAGLKVAELKAELEKREQPVSGKKAELAARLVECCRAEAAAAAAPPQVDGAAGAEPMDAEEGKAPAVSEAAAAAAPASEERGRKRAREDSPPEAAAPLAAAPPATAEPAVAAAEPAAKPAAEPAASDDDAPAVPAFRMPSAVRAGAGCPHLDSVRRAALDFDFEKCCSVSLSRHNVYACLVCGRYFAGRGPRTHAYTHSLEAGHHVFMRLADGAAFCLPDLYEVRDAALADIQRVLRPRFSAADVAALDGAPRWGRALDGGEFMPGLVGLNQLKAAGYATAVVQALQRVLPLRDFFLRLGDADAEAAGGVRGVTARALEGMPLAAAFGELTRKLWLPTAFKGHVSPHEFLQAARAASDGRFAADAAADPVDFFAWLLNALHRELTGGRRKAASVLTECLQGELEVTTRAGTGRAAGRAADLVERVPFFLLALDLPPAPLYRDSVEERVTIPQVPLAELLGKYDGAAEADEPRAGRRRFRLARLPRYLALHVRRFARNAFFAEKNPTIVNFPVRGLDLAASLPPPDGEFFRPLYQRPSSFRLRSTHTSFVCAMYERPLTAAHPPPAALQTARPRATTSSRTSRTRAPRRAAPSRRTSTAAPRAPGTRPRGCASPRCSRRSSPSPRRTSRSTSARRRRRPRRRRRRRRAARRRRRRRDLRARVLELGQLD
jgi:U4/U6.U5 tri-snRNP-associated protein 2